MNEILHAVALLLVIEGIMPFLSPVKWRETMQQISQFSDNALRWIGLISMLAGVILLYIMS
ncbi:MAG: DUF2065 domain-containing protein [Gammaproteobacteria bacterium]|nr:DUF2065 domain-containing protein [Gammaproteobacteria bacterium]